MKLINAISIFLGTSTFFVLIWFGYQWWNSRFGKQSSLLNDRINQLVGTKATEADGTLSIFKEPIFSDNPNINFLLKKLSWAHKLNDLLERSNATYTVHYFLVIVAGFFLISLLASALILDSFSTALSASVLFAMTPFVLLKIQYFRRKAIIERQLPDMIDFISRALTAGHSFTSALQAGALQAPEPISTQFRLTFEQLNFGVPLKDAMADLVKRLQTEEVRFFAIAVVLNREVGGNLTELLNDVSKLMRQRLTAKLVIKSLTSEGKSTAMFLGILPLIMALVLEVFNPGYFEPVLKSSIGIKLYVGTALWAIAGFVWMRSIANIRL